MKKIYVNELENYLEQEITFSAFIDVIRDKKWVQFIILKDSTGKVQATVEKSVEENKEMVELVSSLTKDSVVEIEGKLVKNDAVKLGGMEIIPKSIKVLSKAEELPFDYNNTEGVSIDTRLNHRFLDLRNQKNLLMFKVQTCLVNAMREFVIKNNFIEIHTPKIIGTASESGSEVFKLDYFNRDAYLAQSPQFYKQMAMCSGFDRVFEIAPAFRAENSNSYRHATDFTSFDLEMSYLENLDELMDFEEDLLINALSAVKEKYQEEIKELFGIEINIPTKPFPRMKLEDLYKELEKEYNFKMDFEDIGDMNAESEKLAYKYIKEKYGHEFVFITDFSAKKRAFYHKRNSGIPMGADLIWKGCEITTLAIRENRYEILKQQAKEKGLTEDVKFYLEFFKYGAPPHGGFGLGIDRLTMLLLETSSLKETMFLFRGPNRLEP